MSITITIIVILLIVLASLGMPLAFALGVAGVVGLILTMGFDSTMGIVGSTPFRQAASLVLTTIPMYILMAEIANESKITERLFALAQALLGRVRGGLGLATIAAATMMGAMSGSSSASTATFAATAAPEMEKRGYSQKLAMGIVSSAGTIAIMIPPSLAFILYGVVTQTSIGMLFLSGIIPGLLTAVFYAVTVLILVRKDNVKIKKYYEENKTNVATWLEKVKMLRSLGPVLLVAFVVVGGLYSGIMTATEAGAVGALAMLVVAALQRSLKFKALNIALNNTLRTTTMVMSILICAFFFGYFLTTTHVASNMVDWASGLDMPRYGILIIILVIYLILGFFMDQTAILIITLPITFPLIVDLHFSPILFGVLITKTVEIGMIHPPFGMNCFIAASIRKIPSETVFVGTFPFVIAELLCLATLMIFPQLATYIPDYVSSLR